VAASTGAVEEAVLNVAEVDVAVVSVEVAVVAGVDVAAVSGVEVAAVDDAFEVEGVELETVESVAPAA
jgi:hypothetical protein